MCPMRKTSLVLLLALQLVASVVGQDEAVEGLENSDIINHLRGDTIIPEESYYDDSTLIPVHNDFADEYDSEHSSYDYDNDVCDNPICWSSTCSEAMDDIRCGCCPKARPVRMADIDLEVSCSPNGALVGYNLSSVLGFDLENLTVVLSYHIDGEQDSLDRQEVEDFDDTEFSWPGLCSGIAYQFCVEVTHAHMSKLDDQMMCKVSFSTVLCRGDTCTHE